MSQLKREFKVQFTNDINILNGEEFEIFCKNYMGFILGEKIEHKGHNLFGKPVKNTVDFSTYSYNISGQAGTEITYFKNFTKPLDDIKKALKLNPNAEEIWLFSNQYAGTSKLMSLQQEIISKNILCMVKVFDSDSIAEHLLENSYKLDVNSELFDYLPASKKLLSIFPNEIHLPSHKNNYFNREEEDEIIKILYEQNYIQIYGLSGSGKTEISISIAEKIKSQYDTVIWIDSAFKNNELINFEAVQLTKYNALINLATLLETYKILLIIDNQNKDVENIVKNFSLLNKKESKLLVTSLSLSLEQSKVFLLNGVSEKVANNILLDIGSLPPEDIKSELYQYFGRSPLLLQVIGRFVKKLNSDWELIKLIQNEIGEIVDSEKNIKVNQRLVQEYLNSYKKELSFLGYINELKINQKLAVEIIGIIGIENLKDIAFIDVVDHRFLTIHQIILDSINTEIRVNDFQDQFDSKINNYLWTQKDIKDKNYYNILYQHRLLFEKKIKINSNKQYLKIVVYSLIQATFIYDQPKMNNLFSLVTESLMNPKDVYDINLLIEYMEYNLANNSKNTTQMKEYATECLSILENLISLHKDQLLPTLLHHYAKILGKVGKHDEAYLNFQNVLNLKPNDPFVLLQLIRLERHRKKHHEAEELIKQVLSLKNISFSVLLSVYEILSKNDLASLREQYFESKITEFTKIIIESINLEYEHLYRVLGNLSKYIAFKYPINFETIVQNLPKPALLSTNEPTRLNYANILSAYYKVLKYKDLDYDESELNKKKQEVFSIASNYYKNSNLDDWTKKSYIDLLIEAGDFITAKNISETVSNQDDIFLKQKLCKIYRGLNLYEMSIEVINFAILEANIKKEKHEYVAAFYNDYAETLYAMNDKNCLSKLTVAIDLQTQEETRRMWEEKLELWASNFEQPITN